MLNKLKNINVSSHKIYKQKKKKKEKPTINHERFAYKNIFGKSFSILHLKILLSWQPEMFASLVYCNKI